jgi:calcium-dependent protein kinase
LEGKEYTNKCDIWSLGLVLYELLFGRTPWLCRSFDTYLMEIKTKPLQFPYEVEISQNVKDFIKRCLKIEEHNRMGCDELLKHPMLLPQGKLKR